MFESIYLYLPHYGCQFIIWMYFVSMCYRESHIIYSLSQDDRNAGLRQSWRPKDDVIVVGGDVIKYDSAMLSVLW